jgi:hypothetical protein
LWAWFHRLLPLSGSIEQLMGWVLTDRHRSKKKKKRGSGDNHKEMNKGKFKLKKIFNLKIRKIQTQHCTTIWVFLRNPY